MNPAPCVPIEQKKIPGVILASNTPSFLNVRTCAQIRKVWNPGESEYFLWIPQEMNFPGKHRNAGNRWWQPPC